MSTTTVATASFSAPGIALQSKDHEEILDVIDKLRSQGISKYLNLPQLIVCGDQSSGKSSVLEAISGLSFPTKDNLCTRFATELILRRGVDVGVSVTIQPDDNRSESEREMLRKFKSPSFALEDFAGIVKNAEEAMELDKNAQTFSRDVLRVEVSGPKQLPLTLVDLPGLYHAPDESQDDEGIALVESLVLSYMRNERSIMLAVISAKSDLALQKVTAFTRKVDPQGRRTLGIITKPDTLHEGSDMELSFVKLAKNERVAFRLGWHVLKNRDYDQRESSLETRHRLENEFLSKGVWASLPSKQLGIDALRVRLSTVLKDQILSQLPGLVHETQEGVNDTLTSLLRLGESRADIGKQRRYLLHVSENFTTLVGGAINGFYMGPFFGDAMSKDGYSKRLRAVVQNTLLDFAEIMRDQGQERRLVVDADLRPGHDLGKGQIRRSDFVEEVQVRVRRSRGRELPGTFNPLIIGDLFYLQSKPWKRLVGDCNKLLLERTRETLFKILIEVADEKTMEGILQHVVHPALERLEMSLEMKIGELLKPHEEGHPITYNHYFTENVQKAREEHLRRTIVEKLEGFFGRQYPNTESSNTQKSFIFSMSSLVETLGRQTEVDMDSFSCSEAVDCMEAYYKVALKKFVDDFSILAVEKCLLEQLLGIFSPKIVEALDEDIVQNIAAENIESRLERARLEEKLAELRNALQELRRLDKHKISSRVADDDIDFSDDHLKFDSENSSRGTSTPTRNGMRLEDMEEAVEASAPEVMEEQCVIPETVQSIEEGFDFTAQAKDDAWGAWEVSTTKSPKKSKKAQY